MKKHSKFLRSLIAIVISLLLAGSVIPTMALAGGNEIVTEESAPTGIDVIINSFKAFLDSLKAFVESIINFFKNPCGEQIIVPDGTEVTSAESLREAIANDDQIYLTENITFSEPLELNNDIEINLNGKELAVDRLIVSADVTIEDGLLTQEEADIKDEYGFLLDNNSAIYVDGGSLTLNNTKIATDTPSRIQINNNSVTETVGIHIVSGEVVLNNCELVVENLKAYGKLLQYEGVFAARIDSGKLTLNDSSISLKGIGARDGAEYIAFIGGPGATEKAIALNNTQIDGAMLYAAGMGSNFSITTTDTEDLWTGKYANCTVEFAA